MKKKLLGDLWFRFWVGLLTLSALFSLRYLAPARNVGSAKAPASPREPEQPQHKSELSDAVRAVVKSEESSSRESGTARKGTGFLELKLGERTSVETLIELPSAYLLVFGVAEETRTGSNEATSTPFMAQLHPLSGPNIFFGTGGIVGAGDRARAVVLTPGGEILVAGGAAESDKVNPGGFVVRRYTSLGRLDRAWLGLGEAHYGAGSGAGPAEHIVLSEGGGFYLAGPGGDGAASNRYAVMRALPSGEWDKAYGEKGMASLPFPGETRVLGLFPRKDGALFLVGYVSPPRNDERVSEQGLFVARLSPQGKSDAAFGEKGKIWYRGLGPDFFATAVARTPEDKFVVSGAVRVPFREDQKPVAAPGPVLVRLSPDGKPDPTFGENGIARLPMYGAAIALAPEGKILLAGHDLGDTENSHAAVGRFDSGGRPDPNFGSNGIVILSPRGLTLTTARAITIEPSSGVIDAACDIGSSRAKAADSVALVTLTPEGKVDERRYPQGKLVREAANITTPDADPNPEEKEPFRTAGHRFEQKMVDGALKSMGERLIVNGQYPPGKPLVLFDLKTGKFCKGKTGAPIDVSWDSPDPGNDNVTLVELEKPCDLPKGAIAYFGRWQGKFEPFALKKVTDAAKVTALDTEARRARLPEREFEKEWRDGYKTYPVASLSFFNPAVFEASTERGTIQFLQYSFKNARDHNKDGPLFAKTEGKWETLGGPCVHLHSDGLRVDGVSYFRYVVNACEGGWIVDTLKRFSGEGRNYFFLSDQAWD